ncbi:unnamed protein product [Urochloa humidicola]
MDSANRIKKQPAAAAPARSAAADVAAKKKLTTLLDAYEVECIRRELERLVLKHNLNNQTAATASAPPNARVHRRRHDDDHVQLQRHQRVISSARTKATSARRVSPSPSPSPPPAAYGPGGPKKKGRSGGTRLLGRHAVAICSGTAPVAAAGGAPVVGGRGRRAVAICSGGAPVACATVGRRRPRRGFREVEKV